MKTVSDVARLFDVSGNTIRNWAGEFADHLSQSANPPKGQTRQFTDGDMAVLTVVATMRDEDNASNEQIHAALRAGEHESVEVPEEPAAPRRRPRSKAAPQPEERALTPIDFFERFAERLDEQYKGQIEQLQSERDDLRRRLDEAREARLDAEKRASELKGRLSIVEAQEPAESGKSGAQERRWWEFWKA